MTLAEKILAYSEGPPEGAPISAKELLHLGERAAVGQALSRLARRQEFMRAARGLYVRPIQTKYGVRAPMPEKIIQQLSNIGGETIVSSGAAAANALGLTTQVPIKTVYLTSGRSRQFALGKLTLELRHAKPWQLAKGHEEAGQAARALVWLGRAHADKALPALKERLSTQGWAISKKCVHFCPNGLPKVLVRLFEPMLQRCELSSSVWNQFRKKCPVRVLPLLPRHCCSPQVGKWVISQGHTISRRVAIKQLDLPAPPTTGVASYSQLNSDRPWSRPP